MPMFIKKVWRDKTDGLDLISLEGSQIKVHLYEANTSQLRALCAAAEEVLGIVANLETVFNAERKHS